MLRLVQPNADQALKWNPAFAETFLQRLVTLSASPAPRRPDLVVWPETAVNFLLNDAAPVLPALAASAQGAPLVLGIQRGEGERWFNSLVEIAPDGRIVQSYDKVHLVPFGEYIPWGDALARLGLGAFAAQNGFGYTPGEGFVAMTIAGLPPVQPLICYEAVFPQHLRGVEADWTLQITNDAWFGTFSGPYQHLAQARLRAIESGRPLVRAANTGVSAVIDARGRVTARIALGVAGFVDAALPGRLPPTPWLRFGDVPLLLAALLAALAVAIADRFRRPIDARGGGG